MSLTFFECSDFFSIPVASDLKNGVCLKCCNFRIDFGITVIRGGLV